MRAYATLEQLQTYLPNTTDDDADALTSLLERASRAIDSYTRRTPSAFAMIDATPSEQIIYGDGRARLELPFHVPKSLVSVTDFAGNVLRVTVFRGELFFCDERGVLVTTRAFERGAPYRVTARWGYEETPGDITEACLHLATRWWRAKDEAFSGVIGNINRDGSIIERGFPPAVKQLLDPYVLPEREDDKDNGGFESAPIRSLDFV